MKKYFCDICGREIGLCSRYLLKWDGKESENIRICDDMCVKCFEKIINFIKSLMMEKK